MSGGDGGWTGSTSFDCGSLMIKVRLSSVDEEVLKTISVGTQLSISLEKDSVVAKKDLKIVGSISSREVIDLLDCLNKGKKFMGTVVEIDDGKCIIMITPIK